MDPVETLGNAAVVLGSTVNIGVSIGAAKHARDNFNGVDLDDKALEIQASGGKENFVAYDSALTGLWDLTRHPVKMGWAMSHQLLGGIDYPSAAAKNSRKIWQGHDLREEDEERARELCVDGAAKLSGILNHLDGKEQYRVGELVRNAFWLTDEAEVYQGKNLEIEDLLYDLAGVNLEESRDISGREKESVTHRIGSYQAYRHRDEEELYNELLNEHLMQFGDENFEDAETCTELWIDAARIGHDQDEWDYVDERLTEYYEIALAYVADDKAPAKRDTRSTPAYKKPQDQVALT